MIASNDNITCGQASIYYYDYLCDEQTQDIPSGIVEHIDECNCCIEEIVRLKVELSVGDEEALAFSETKDYLESAIEQIENLREYEVIPKIPREIAVFIYLRILYPYPGLTSYQFHKTSSKLLNTGCHILITPGSIFRFPKDYGQFRLLIWPGNNHGFV